MLGTMMKFPLTLTPVLERAGKLFGAVEVASRLPDQTIHRSNYAAVCRRARALAGAATAQGLSRGERIGSLMWNHLWHLEAYFGVPASGCILHTLNPRLHPDELAYIVNHGGDRLLIVDDVLLPVFEKFQDKVHLDRVVVVATTGRKPGKYQEYEDFLQEAPEDYQFPELGEDEGAVMCYTSGTTGVPKGIIYSHRALVLHSFAVALPDSFNLAQVDCALPIVPMFHANGWGVVPAATMVGAKLVLPGPHLDAGNLLDLLDREKVTRAAGVPTVWLGILDLLDRHPGRWNLQPSLLVAVGGAALPESMIRSFDRHAIQVRQAWGMTELTPVGTVNRLKTHMLQWNEAERVAIRAKQGIALPFIEVRALDGDREVPWDGRTMGELQVRGPWVAGSYYNSGDLQQNWTEDGWFRTGDVVTISPEGYIKITDRTKDLIKSGGEWISSIDLENALMGHPAVREAAVVAIPHPKWQERPLAAVVIRDSCHTTEEELREYLASRFSRWQLPDGFVFVGEIPRTSVGKFQKTRLRETFAGWEWSHTASEDS
jgi:fatty-acyl-CoA synthase